MRTIQRCRRNIDTRAARQQPIGRARSSLCYERFAHNEVPSLEFLSGKMTQAHFPGLQESAGEGAEYPTRPIHWPFYKYVWRFLRRKCRRSLPLSLRLYPEQTAAFVANQCQPHAVRNSLSSRGCPLYASTANRTAERDRRVYTRVR